MMTATRPLTFHSSYGSLLGTFALDERGDEHALISEFEPIVGAVRPVNYRLAMHNLDEDLAKAALTSVVMTEAGKPAARSLAHLPRLTVLRYLRRVDPFNHAADSYPGVVGNCYRVRYEDGREDDMLVGRIEHLETNRLYLVHWECEKPF